MQLNIMSSIIIYTHTHIRLYYTSSASVGIHVPMIARPTFYQLDYHSNPEILCLKPLPLHFLSGPGNTIQLLLL